MDGTEKYKATALKLHDGTDSPAHMRVMNVRHLPWPASGTRRDGFRNSYIQALAQEICASP